MFSDSRHIMRTEFDTSTIRQFIMGSAPVSPGSWEVKGHLTKKFCSQGGFSENTPNKGVHHHFSSNVGQICRGIVRIFGSWLKSKWNNVVKTVSINHPPVITIFIGGMYNNSHSCLVYGIVCPALHSFIWTFPELGVPPSSISCSDFPWNQPSSYVKFSKTLEPPIFQKHQP